MTASQSFGSVLASRAGLRLRADGYFGMCPFHKGFVPTFHVEPESGGYRCSACGAAGTPYEYLRLTAGLAFPDALRALAGSAVEVEGEAEGAEVRKLRLDIIAANEVAARWYAKRLFGEGGQPARDYCRTRGIDRRTVDDFEIGYAPESKIALRTALDEAGIPREVAVAAGLLKQSPRGDYAFHRGRLAIPTRTETGDLVAFGGRAIAEGGPKYINTSVSPVHRKESVLFALDRAREAILEAGEAVVVEGYLDCISLHQAGVRNAVASLGTSFTAEQVHLLARMGVRVAGCFDGDDAGRKAAKRSADLLDAAGVTWSSVALPEGMDPDEFVRERGADDFRRAVAEGVPAEEYRRHIEAAVQAAIAAAQAERAAT